MFAKILLAVDRSEESCKAFKKAVKIASDNQATLTILHALGIPTDFDYKLLAPDDDQRNLAKAEAIKLLESYREEALRDGVPAVDILVKTGAPRRVIIDEAIPKLQPDLVIVGATGTTALDRIFIGSVSEYVVRHSPVDVLVVRS